MAQQLAGYPQEPTMPVTTAPAMAQEPQLIQPQQPQQPPMPGQQKPGMSFGQMLQIAKMMEAPQTAGRVGGGGGVNGMPTRSFQAALVNSPAVQAPPTLAALLAGRRR